MFLATMFNLGSVSDGAGKTKTDVGYITYEINGEEGEIEVSGPKAALIADRIAKLLNSD